MYYIRKSSPYKEAIIKRYLVDYIDHNIVLKFYGNDGKESVRGGINFEKENDDGIHYWSNEFKYIRGCLSF